MVHRYAAGLVDGAAGPPWPLLVATVLLSLQPCILPDLQGSLPSPRE